MMVAYRKGSKLILAGNPEKGERWFCPEAEVFEVGWSKAGD